MARFNLEQLQMQANILRQRLGQLQEKARARHELREDEFAEMARLTRQVMQLEAHIKLLRDVEGEA